MAGKLDDLDLPKMPTRPAAPSNVPGRVADLPRPNAVAAEPNAGSNAIPARQQPTEPRTMLVGQGITISGDISSCNRLVIEGSLEAKLHDCRQVEIAEHGTFKGNASVEQCDVSGQFEGELVVKNRLLIRATGHVSGTITYAQIEIERGGKLSGTVRTQEEAAAAPNFGVVG
jgi:cytoskeletal protein CcmA (bactofilin family)